MIRKLSIALLAMVMAGGGLAAMPGAGAQSPDNPNLDLTIDPTQGLPGTVIDSSVPPAQALAECIGNIDDLEADIAAALTAAIAEATTQGEAGIAALLTGVLGALPTTIDGLVTDGILDIAAFYPLLFVDIPTEDRLAESTWNPVTGTGEITAPDAPLGTYAVVAACVGLNDISPAALVAAVDAALDAADQTDTIALCLPALLQQGAPSADCLAATGNDPATFFGAAGATVGQAALGAILPNPDDPNITGLGFALYCLGDEAFCAGPPDEGPVAAEPTFTG